MSKPKSVTDLAQMSDESYERYLKRHRISGMAAVNLSIKRRRAKADLDLAASGRANAAALNAQSRE